MSKPKTITLYHPINAPVTLDEAHALRVLAMENNGGWYVKEESDKPKNDDRADQEKPGKSGGKK